MSTPARSFDTAALRSYLTEIDAVPLLSADEERELAARVAEGGAEARDRLVRSNLRLVVSIAGSFRGWGLPLEDLIAEGNLGLIRAAEGFDPSAKVRFATYAGYWIRQSIRAALIKYDKPVRLPYHMVKQLSKWRRASDELGRELGRSPTAEEVGRALKLDRRRLEGIVQALRVLEVQARPLEVPAGPDGPGPSEELADERALPVEEQVDIAEEIAGLPRRLARLDEREATIVWLRFGLGGGLPMTLHQVGRALGGYSRERVRQLEQQALVKLRGDVV
jgi:RNA polymerase primary sigma factor